MALKILLADDSMIAQNLGKKILTDAGHEVVAVSNGAAAVKKIAEVKPQLAILDIYMPGYTGLEVCERMKNSPETSKIPVILTVGKMEPYRPEDGARVKAEGVIIKPFEGSDLIAAVNKLAEKLAPAKPVADYEQTVVLSQQEIQEFKDASYEEWKSETAESSAPAAPAHDMSLPAFGFDELPVQPPAAPSLIPMAAAAVASAAPFTAPVVSMGVADAPVFAVEDMPTVAPIDPFAPTDTQPIEPLVDVAPPDSAAEIAPQAQSVDEPEVTVVAPESETETAFIVVPTATQELTFDLPATEVMPDLEFNAAAPVEVQVQATPDFEPTILQDEIIIADSFAVDPALVTDVTEMASAFPTKFGVENAEDVPVGVFTEDTMAAAEPEIFADPNATFEPKVQASVEAEPFVTELPTFADEAAITLPTVEAAPVGDPAAHSIAALPQFEEFLPAMADTMSESTTSEIAPIAAAPETAPDTVPNWQAHETTVDASEAAVSLDEEMQRAFASLEEKLEAPLVPVVPVEVEAEPVDTFGAEVASIAPEFTDVRSHVPEPMMDTAPAPAISGDPELAAAMEAALASLDTNEVPETLIEVPASEEPQAIAPEAAALPEPELEAPPVEVALQPEAETIIEEVSVPAVAPSVTSVEVLAEDELLLGSEGIAEPALPELPELDAIEIMAPEELAEAAAPAAEVVPGSVIAESESDSLEAIETEVMRRAAVMEPTMAVVNDVVPAQPTVDEARIATAVTRVMERMKEHIVAEIVKELHSE